MIYLLTGCFLLCWIIVSMANLLMIVLYKANIVQRFYYTNYGTWAIYIFAAASYLLVSNVDNLEPPHDEKLHVSADSGIPILFFLGAWSIFTFLHYVFLKQCTNYDNMYMIGVDLIHKVMSPRGSTYGVDQELQQKNLELDDINRKIIKKKGQLQAAGAYTNVLEEKEISFEFQSGQASPPQGVLLEEYEELKQKYAILQEEQINREKDWYSQKITLQANIDTLREELTKQGGNNDTASLRHQLNLYKIDADSKQEENQHLQKLIDALRSENLTATDTIKDLRDKYDSDQATIRNLQIRFTETNELLARKEKELMEALQRIDQLDIELKAHGSSGEAMRDSTSSQVTQLNITLNLQRDQIAQLSTDNYNYKFEIEELNYKLNQLSDNYEQARSQLKECRGKLDDLELVEEQNKNLEGKLQDLTVALDDSRQEIRKLELASGRVSVLVKERDSLHVELKKVQDELEEYKMNSSTGFAPGFEVEKEELLTKIARLEAVVDGNRVTIEDLKEKLRNLSEQLQQEKDEHDHDKNLNRREIESLYQRLKSQEEASNREMQELTENVERLRDELRLYKNKYELTLQELQSTKQLLEALRKQLLDRNHELDEIQQPDFNKEYFQNVIKTLEEYKTELEGGLQLANEQLQAIIDEKEDLRQKLMVKTREFNDLTNEFKDLERLLGSRHRQKSFKEGSDSSRSSISSVQSINDLMIIESISKYDMKYNPILETVSRVRADEAMTNSNVWKLFEQLLQEKSQVDRLEISLNRQPRALWEYLSDFMYVHYGIPSLAIKQTKSLVNALEELYRDEHPYGILICRFLGLFHPRPLTLNLQVCLTLLQDQFNTLAREYQPRTSVNYAEHYDEIQLGGSCSIIVLMELTMKICKRHREAGERIIQRFSSDPSKRMELIILKIVCTIANMGKDRDYIFEILDEDHGGTLDYHEFVDGIRYTLNIWVSQDEVEELCSYLDEDNVGQVTHKDWNRKIRFDEYRNQIYSKLAMVPKTQFLNAFIEEYESQVISDFYILRQICPNTNLDFEAFSQFLQRLEPDLDYHTLSAYFEETKEQEFSVKNSVSPEAACLTVLCKHVGGYGVGVFDVIHVESMLPKVRISEKPFSSPERLEIKQVIRNFIQNMWDYYKNKIFSSESIQAFCPNLSNIYSWS